MTNQGYDIGVHYHNHKQISVLEKVFTQPVSHNLTWHDVTTLLDAVGTLEEKHKGSWRTTIGGQMQVFDPNHGKELSTQQVIDLGHILSAAGVELSA